MSEPAPHPLLARAARLTLFVMLRRTVNGALLRDNLTAHLTWMIGEEKRGKIFLSGPVAPHDGPTQLHGLTILRAADMAEAEAIARQDPLIQTGAVTFELRAWTVNEGAIPLTVTLSDSTVSIGSRSSIE